MSVLVYCISARLGRVVQGVPVGTNRALFYLLWMFLGGRLLPARGAVFSGLTDFGLPLPAVRRCGAALASGQGEISLLLKHWQALVEEEGQWKAHEHEGYRPVPCDLVGFIRPHLKGCLGKHYVSVAGKALPAVSFGLLGAVGSVGGQRLAVPRAIVRTDPKDPSETRLMELTLRKAKAVLREKEVLICDRGFSLAQLQKEGIDLSVLRVPQNFTARRAELPPSKGHGRPAE